MGHYWVVSIFWSGLELCTLGHYWVVSGGVLIFVRLVGLENLLGESGKELGQLSEAARGAAWPEKRVAFPPPRGGNKIFEGQILTPARGLSVDGCAPYVRPVCAPL